MDQIFMNMHQYKTDAGACFMDQILIYAMNYEHMEL